MKIVVLMDSFKGTLSSVEACRAVAAGLSSYDSALDIVSYPIADGGEGSLDALMQPLKAKWIPVKVTGPLPYMQADAGFSFSPSSEIAVVEMAAASGITLLKPEQLNPLETTTFGTGELIRAACEMKPDKILLAVGGSATVDCGVGAASALGWKFKDKNGKRLIYGGQTLSQIASIERPVNLNLPPIDVLCDVENPLCGPKGAAAVFAPQKGADARCVEILEAGMLNLCGIVKKQFAIDMNIKHAGAAGGLAAAAVAFMNAKLVSGIDRFIELLKLEEIFRSADMIITGEGKFDSQSLDGKVVSGLAALAAKTHTKMFVLAGVVDVQPQEYGRIGIIDAMGCVNETTPSRQVLAAPFEHLKRLSYCLAEKHQLGNI